MQVDTDELFITGMPQGRLSFSNGFGRIRFGQTRLGLLTELAGIYVKTHTPNGSVIIKKSHYTPTNPQTTGQQAWRSVFADAVIHYRSLTPDELSIYNKRAKRLRMTGYNLCIKEYLASHRI